MVELERRIFVDRDIMLNEYDYMFGDKKNVVVYFYFYNVKRDHETPIHADNYCNVLKRARSRALDGRYKNFEFLIKLT